MVEIKNIKKLAKKYNEAEIYFHIDLDGVMSALIMKEYLKLNNIETVAVHPIQYGPRTYSIPKPQKGKLQVLVDFSDGKPYMHIHTDHHDKQVGFGDKTNTLFTESRSNASELDKLIPKGILSEADKFAIDTIDSANYAENDVSIDDVIFPSDGWEPSKNKKTNINFALLVNKLLLSFKNKTEFMEKIVMDSEPSLKSLYDSIITYTKLWNYADIEQITENGLGYAAEQKKSEHTFMLGNSVMIYGLAGYVARSGSYDRYMIFRNYPEAHYAVVCWPLGLIQVSKNPFKKEYNPYILSEVVWNVLNKMKNKLQRPVSLGYMKLMAELDLYKKTGNGEDSIGFTFDDAYSKYKRIIDFKIYDHISNTIHHHTEADINNYIKKLKKIMSKHWDQLTDDEQVELNIIKIPLWDIIKVNSGGHKDITNISQLNLLGKDYVEELKEIWMAIGNEMKEKSLEGLQTKSKKVKTVKTENNSVVLKPGQEFIITKEPYKGAKLKLINMFNNKHGGNSWIIKFNNDEKQWFELDIMIQSLVDIGLMVPLDGVKQTKAKQTKAYDFNNFDDRLAYGKEAESAVIDDLIAWNINAKKSSDIDGWDSEFDSKFGDIQIFLDSKTVRVDVKRGSKKDGPFKGFVSKKSRDNYVGDYYLFTNGSSLIGAKLLKGSSVKAYMNKVEQNGGLVKGPSGDYGHYFNLDTMRTAIEYNDWIEGVINENKRL